MKEYEEIRSNLIEMLEDLSDRLVRITDDVKHQGEPLAKDLAMSPLNIENFPGRH